MIAGFKATSGTAKGADFHGSDEARAWLNGICSPAARLAYVISDWTR
jgi:hypothetical protein